MRTIDEIKAKIEAYNRYEDVPKELRKEYNEISLQMTQQEECEIYRRYEITKDIPLDRLEEICNAERDGRCVVLPHPIGCKVYHIETDGVLKGMIREVTVAGYSENKCQGHEIEESDVEK